MVLRREGGHPWSTIEDTGRMGPSVVRVVAVGYRIVVDWSLFLLGCLALLMPEHVHTHFIHGRQGRLVGRGVVLRC